MPVSERKENFFLDVENDMLRNCWKQSWDLLIGKKRIENAEWMALIIEKTDVELCKEEYIQWVLDGGGEEWLCSEAGSPLRDE